MDAGLEIAGDPEAVFEADDRSVVQREQILGELAEIAAAQVAGEAVCQAEVAAVARQRLRRLQIDDVELDFGRRRWRSGRVGSLRADDGGAGQKEGEREEHTTRQRGDRETGTVTW